MNKRELKKERKHLKQQLFRIRRHVEGEDVELTDELQTLKDKYEALPGFTTWSHFPERWDIGDPHSVKAGTEAFAFSQIEIRNIKRKFGRPYDEIVHLEVIPKKQQEIEAMRVLQEKRINFEKLMAEIEQKKKLEEELGNQTIELG